MHTYVHIFMGQALKMQGFAAINTDTPTRNRKTKTKQKAR